MDDDRQDRILGMALAHACGDGYGRPLEFVKGPAVRTLHVYTGALVPTDDTHMSLYVGAALRDLPDAFDPDRFGQRVGARFVEWRHDPEIAGTGPGVTCLTGAAAFEAHGDWRRSGVAASDGCGAVMRVWPLPVVLDGDALVQAAEVSSMVTHGHPNAREGAIATACLLRWTLDAGRFDASLVERAIEALRGPWSRGGTVARSLEAALRPGRRSGAWLAEGAIPEGDGGWRSGSALGLAIAAALEADGDLAQTVDLAARIDGDSDSVACIAGALVGAAHGVGVIPAPWLAGLHWRDRIEAMVAGLSALPWRA